MQNFPVCGSEVVDNMSELSRFFILTLCILSLITEPQILYFEGNKSGNAPSVGLIL